MSLESPRLILASSSRYRREMLGRLGIPFASVAPDVDETPHSGEPPHALALRLSIEKAQTVAKRYPGAIVIGSDQVATIDGTPLGKPGNFERAREQLRSMSGRTVDFHSALAVTDGEQIEHADIVTQCRFRKLSEAAIEAYLNKEQPYDTAGSAKAEGLGIALMSGMTSDDPTAIIGLPLIALTGMLARFGLDPLLFAAQPLARTPKAAL
ncbi:Maf family nucleotide pyrophosphatase [Alcaligenaceae bacterium A4P071]|nr:Maf family nucleotide pyrophosphatase [Alcaligenaceae bacterium B3P038]MDQ2150316.1 Maf family nucleotide pyrophosphatase [Alcaligenaceae bacterium C4P045]MDQ2187016.1 Maf family nucleotide pyrophosphatase [Alcaligenaceae bacterium A4P071]